MQNIKLAHQLAKDDGIVEDSVEFFAVSLICKKSELRKFFIDMETTAGRVAFLKRYVKMQKLA